MILVRRNSRSLWRASDRRGRRIAAWNWVLCAVNFGCGVTNALARTWWPWLPLVSFFFGWVCLWAAGTALKQGVRRETWRWIQDETRRRENWKWN